MKNLYLILALPKHEPQTVILITDDSDNNPKFLFTEDEVQQRLEDLSLTGGYTHIAVPFYPVYWMEDSKYRKGF